MKVKPNKNIKIPSKDMYSPTITSYGRFANFNSLEDWKAIIIIIIEMTVNNKLSNIKDSLIWEANIKEDT